MDSLEFKPKIYSDYLLYKRIENDGRVTIKTRIQGMPTKIVNKTFFDIFNYSNGENTIKDILNLQKKKYPKIKKSILLEDILFVMQKLIEMQALSNEFIPLIKHYSINITKNKVLLHCSYTDIKSIKDFMEKDSESVIKYSNPLLMVSYLEALKNNINVPNGNDIMMFKLMKSNNIIGTIVWELETKQIATLNSYIFIEDVNVYEIINSCMVLIKTITKDAYKNFAIYINNDESDPYIENHYNKIGVLQQECKGKDITFFAATL